MMMGMVSKIERLKCRQLSSYNYIKSLFRTKIGLSMTRCDVNGLII